MKAKMIFFVVITTALVTAQAHAERQMLTGRQVFTRAQTQARSEVSSRIMLTGRQVFNRDQERMMAFRPQVDAPISAPQAVFPPMTPQWVPPAPMWFQPVTSPRLIIIAKVQPPQQEAYSTEPQIDTQQLQQEYLKELQALKERAEKQEQGAKNEAIIARAEVLRLEMLQKEALQHQNAPSTGEYFVGGIYTMFRDLVLLVGFLGVCYVAVSAFDVHKYDHLL